MRQPRRRVVVVVVVVGVGVVGDRVEVPFGVVVGEDAGCFEVVDEELGAEAVRGYGLWGWWWCC